MNQCMETVKGKAACACGASASLQDTRMITVALLWPKYHGNISSINELALKLDKERFRVIFIYLSGYGIDKSYLEKTGYEFFCLSNKERISSFNFSAMYRLIGILKGHHVDILHCHRHKATVYGVAAATFAGTPVIMAHVHGLGRSRNFRRRLLNFFLFKKITRIIPVANSVKQDVLKNNWRLPADKLFVLENSVDYERFAGVSVSKEDAKQMLGLPSGAFVFGTAGRLVPTKGLQYLIEAFAKVREQKPSAHLVLLGDGQCKDELEQQASRLACSDSTHFPGYRNNIEQLLKALDVFVLSSVAEGMPRIILEAMASGVPCIATCVGGIPEIINSDDIGRLVPPRDSAALAQAMIGLANATKKEYESYAQNAQNRIRQLYSHEVVGVKLGNLYESEFKAFTMTRPVKNA